MQHVQLGCELGNKKKQSGYIYRVTALFYFPIKKFNK